MWDRVKTGHYIGMWWDIYPALYVLIVRYGLEKQIILEVLTVNYKAALCQDLPDLQ